MTSDHSFHQEYQNGFETAATVSTAEQDEFYPAEISLEATHLEPEDLWRKFYWAWSSRKTDAEKYQVCIQWKTVLQDVTGEIEAIMSAAEYEVQGLAVEQDLDIDGHGLHECISAALFGVHEQGAIVNVSRQSTTDPPSRSSMSDYSCTDSSGEEQEIVRVTPDSPSPPLQLPRKRALKESSEPISKRLRSRKDNH